MEVVGGSGGSGGGSVGNVGRVAGGYQSDDEYYSNRLRRKKQYSKEDFKEIYCINQKAVEGLEKSRSTGFLFLGCLSSYQESPCKRRAYTRSTSTESSSSFFTSCYGAPDRPSVEDQPRYLYYYHEPLYAQTSSSSRIVDLTREFDDKHEFRARPRSVASNISRENLYNEAKRFTWNEQLERYVEVQDWHTESVFDSSQIKSRGASSTTTTTSIGARAPATRYPSAPLSAQHLDHSRKHVSFTDSYFTRSATSNSFDEHKIRKARFDLMNGGISQERLIDGRKTPEMTPVLQNQQQQQMRATSRASLVGSRTSLVSSNRTQATQTETFIVRANGPPPYLSLSPRVSHRSRMISQPTQTNGLPAAPKTITPTPTPNKKMVELPEQTEEEFHENFLSLLTSPIEQSSDSLPTVISQKSSKQTSTTSPTESTSSSGSYSLTTQLLQQQSNGKGGFKVSQLELPGEISDAENELMGMLLPPAEGFGDNNIVVVKSKGKRKSVRAKSEERTEFKIDAATQSSISLHASLHDLTTLDDDDSGIYMEPYTSGVWIYIGENEELQVWKKHEPLARTSSGESTLSEQEFCKKFIALTHRMVHRKASGETYRRLADNSLEINKRLTLTRSSPSGEFGFRIHGSRPVVVSAVESNSPAESAGLEVGDVIMSINGIHVLESSHSDVVRIAGQVEALECELARTADVCNYLTDIVDDDVLIQGDMDKFNGSFNQTGFSDEITEDGGNGIRDIDNEGNWVARFFKLRLDYCLYWYKSKDSLTPLGVLPLTRPQQIELETFDLSLRHVIKLRSFSSSQQQEQLVYMSTEDVEEYSSWIQTINTVIHQSVQDDKWIGISGKFVMSPPSAITYPDCIGSIWKLGRRVKTWQKRIAVVKDACLYFFNDKESLTALGATHVHGYRVQTVSILGGKRHAFELVPPINSMRHYYLATDSEHERKRWLAALEYSIDRWINLNSKRNF